MLLNSKLHLNVTKQLVFFFAPKIINNLLSNDFLNGVRVQVCDQVKDLRTSQRRQYHQRRVVPPA